MFSENSLDFCTLYSQFQAPITEFDCGQFCAPYNEHRVPFCCDIRHTVPTAYRLEWAYLQKETNLWQRFQANNIEEIRRLENITPPGQVLLTCLGHQLCQRDFRTITCRSFPFFPYIDQQNEFIGLSYYWEYEDRCWVISNLGLITQDYLDQFMAAYDLILDARLDEKENYRHHSIIMRRSFGRRHRSIPLLHRNGQTYSIAPGNGHLTRVNPEKLAKFGPYQLAAELPFPDEISPQQVL